MGWGRAEEHGSDNSAVSSAEEFKESKGSSRKSLSARKIRLEEGWGRAYITAQFSELEGGQNWRGDSECCAGRCAQRQNSFP